MAMLFFSLNILRPHFYFYMKWNPMCLNAIHGCRHIIESHLKKNFCDKYLNVETWMDHTKYTTWFMCQHTHFQEYEWYKPQRLKIFEWIWNYRQKIYIYFDHKQIFALFLGEIHFFFCIMQIFINLEINFFFFKWIYTLNVYTLNVYSLKVHCINVTWKKFHHKSKSGIHLKWDSLNRCCCLFKQSLISLVLPVGLGFCFHLV